MLESEPRRCSIRKFSKRLMYWTMFVILLAVYNAIFLPLQMTFKEIEALFETNNYLNALELLIDAIFIFDIAVGFLTSFYDRNTGDEIFCYKRIAKNYLRGEFWIDLFSSIPFIRLGKWLSIESAGYTGFAQLMKLLKLFRIRRIPKLISSSTADKETKMNFKVLFIVFILCIWVHCIACLLWSIFLLQPLENRWIPPLDFMFVETDLYDADSTVLH